MSTLDKYLWQIMVPCNWNNGRPITRRTHTNWAKGIRFIAGGMAILDHPNWILRTSSGQDDDRVVPVQIYASEKEMAEIIAYTMNHYRLYVVVYFTLSRDSHRADCTTEQRRDFDVADNLQSRTT